MESRSPHVATSGPATNAESKLPGVVPPTTVFLAEGHDVGKALTSFKDQLADVPELKEPITQLDDALALLGGPEAIVGWIGEAGVAVTLDGADIAGGLVIVPNDAAAAEKLLDQLNALIQLGGARPACPSPRSSTREPPSRSSTCPASAAWSARCRRAPSRPRPTSSSPMP